MLRRKLGRVCPVRGAVRRGGERALGVCLALKRALLWLLLFVVVCAQCYMRVSCGSGREWDREKGRFIKTTSNTGWEAAVRDEIACERPNLALTISDSSSPG